MNEETVLSFSSLKEFAKSPAHFLAYKLGAKVETSAMKLGTAVHVSVLESDKFYKKYEKTDLRRNTKAYKIMAELNPEKIYLNNSEWKAVHSIKDGVALHELANDLIGNADKFEEEITGSIEGIPFRGIVDAMGVNYLVDLKTTSNGSPSEFQRSAYNFKYYLQAAIYCELTGIQDFWIVTAESSAPYNITPYLLDREYIERGKEELFALLSRYKAWIKNKDTLKNCGYDYCIDAESFYTLSPPKWA